MTNENEIKRLSDLVMQLEEKIAALEKDLSAKHKIVTVLMNRVERSIDISGGAFSVFERNILLQELVEERTRELKEAINRIKKLSGLLPICARCKSIRNDSGYWQEVDVYIRDHSDAEFSHSLCPRCVKELYPDLKLK